jgi:hypothetical protein
MTGVPADPKARTKPHWRMHRITIDIAHVPVQVVGQTTSIGRLAVTVQQAGDGTRLVLHDERDPSSDPLAGWRASIRAAMTRPVGRTLDGLDLNAWTLTRFAAAARKSERLTIFSGPDPADPLLVVVEEHFAGLAVTPRYLDEAAETLRGSPWPREIGE